MDQSCKTEVKPDAFSSLSRVISQTLLIVCCGRALGLIEPVPRLPTRSQNAVLGWKLSPGSVRFRRSYGGRLGGR